MSATKRYTPGVAKPKRALRLVKPELKPGAEIVGDAVEAIGRYFPGPPPWADEERATRALATVSDLRARLEERILQGRYEERHVLALMASEAAAEVLWGRSLVDRANAALLRLRGSEIIGSPGLSAKEAHALAQLHPKDALLGDIPLDRWRAAYEALPKVSPKGGAGKKGLRALLAHLLDVEPAALAQAMKDARRRRK